MIEARQLTKRHGGRTVVSDVTFRCEPGTITGFLCRGPGPSSKQTTSTPSTPRWKQPAWRSTSPTAAND